MSKTFESIGNCLELSVGKVDNESLVGVELRHTNGRWVGIASLAPSDAPALALAILEAAGVDDVDSGNTSCAVADLRTFIARQERITAEAEAQAKLEAEALELHQLFESLQSDDETVWLAVARRAREMRAEK